VAWWTCFGLEWGVIGLWLGLAAGLAFVATTLLVIWARKSALPAPALSSS